MLRTPTRSKRASGTRCCGAIGVRDSETRLWVGSGLYGCRMVEVRDAPDAVRQRLWALWPQFNWHGARYDRGAFHDVFIIAAANVVARITRSRFAADAAAERNALLLQLADRVESFQTPAPVSEPERWSDRHVAVLHTFVCGQEQTDLDDGDSHEIGRVIDSIQLHSDLLRARTVRSFCGGADFPSIIDDVIAPAMAHECSRAARSAVEQLLAAETAVIAQPVHGDLTRFNLRWDDGQVVGVIDWDHAAMGDPAIDIAGILTSFGTNAAKDISDAGTLHRASLHRATFPLQVAAAGHLHDDERLQSTGIRNFEQRHRDGTLHWPEDRAHRSHSPQTR